LAWGDSVQSISKSAEVVGVLGRALVMAAQSLQQPWLIATVALVMMMYLACVGLGTACVRIAIRQK
jgi:hypothetical protein